MTKKDYELFANEINQIGQVDPVLQNQLVKFTVGIFAQDNPAFLPTQENETECTAHCGCKMTTEDADGSACVSFYQCHMHDAGPKLLEALRDLSALVLKGEPIIENARQLQDALGAIAKASGRP